MRPIGANLKPGREDNQQGFSIIEVLIAMAILALAMLAAITMQLGSIRNNASGNMVTQASMLAKAQMEVLKNTPEIEDIVDGDEFNIDALANYNNGTTDWLTDTFLTTPGSSASNVVVSEDSLGDTVATIEVRCITDQP